MKRKVTFPHFANYSVPVDYLITRGVGTGYVSPQPITQRTLELGTLNAPDYACAPCKIHLDCHLEARET